LCSCSERRRDSHDHGADDRATQETCSPRLGPRTPGAASSRNRLDRTCKRSAAQRFSLDGGRTRVKEVHVIRRLAKRTASRLRVS
jgi:hypothetical protein